MWFQWTKTRFEESVNKDSDIEYVQLECSDEEHNNESFHEKEEQKFPQVEEPDVIL